jgi:Cytochrome c554 and c-prime
MRPARCFGIVHWTWPRVVALAGVMLCCAVTFRVAPSVSADEPLRSGPYKHPPIDPVQANGQIFVDWPKPDVALLLTGERNGFLEPCGCAGLENQKGGLKRLHALVKQLRAQGWLLVPMDLGGQTQRFGMQAEMKFSYAMKALAEIGYQVVGLGLPDLRLDILSLVINLDKAHNPFVSANVAIVGFDSGFTKRYKIIEAGGMRVGVTTVLGKKQMAGLENSDDLTLLDPYQAISQVLPDLRDANCDHLVLLSYADLEETKDFARRFHEFDIVVTALGAEEPPNEPRPIDGAHSSLIEVGQKGMYAIVIGLYRAATGQDQSPSGARGTTPFRYQRVPLDARFGDTPEMQQIMVDYQRDLETIGLDGLGLKPTMHPSGRLYAGSAACADCHTAATDVYAKTPHAHATDTLVHLDPPRHFDPECLSCHVTGWDPQRYFPFTSGYLGLKKTPEMVGNGCENCHGPAARHAAAENGEIDVDEQELARLRTELHLEIVDNEGNKEGQEFAHGKVVQMCVQCHDPDNSPDFDFQTYWPYVKHKGKD